MSDINHKAQFLTKVIDITKLVTKINFDINIKNVLSGLETEKTNILLQNFYTAATSKMNFAPIINKYLGKVKEKTEEEEEKLNNAVPKVINQEFTKNKAEKINEEKQKNRIRRVIINEKEKMKVKIFWIDKNVNNSENTNYLKQLKGDQRYEKLSIDLICFEELEDAFYLLRNYYDFDFRVVFIIVSGSLYPYYYQILNQNLKFIKCLPICIIFTSEKLKEIYLSPYSTINISEYYITEEIHESINNSFYNLGGISTDFYSCINFIYNYNISLENKYEITLEKDESYEGCFTFECVNTKNQLVFPFLYHEIMNEDNNVSNNEIQIFKNFLLINHRNNKITNLILPILYIKDIPHDIICKYFLKAYTLETNFYKEMNRLLMKQSGNHYHTFIKVLYEGLFNKSITKSLDACLYRGTKMNHNEIDKIIKLYNEWKTKGDKSIPSFLLYSRCFLSFTKDEDQIGIFIKKKQNEEKCYSIEFILNNNENLINNLSSNADLEFISAIKKEKEVLFFPFSCFCVENITKGKFKDIDCIKINLNYLGKYSAMINDIIKEKNFSIDYIDTFNEQNYVKEIIKSNIILPSNNENKENKILKKIETKIKKKFNKKINFENENKNKETNEKKLIFPVINSEEKIILDEKDNKNKINDDINKDKDSTNLLNIIIEQRKKENKNYFFYFTSLKPSQIEYIWKGEYNKSNKKHGKGKDYDFDDNIIFEGIYENGSRKNGIEYYIIGTKRYEGEYKNKLRWNGIFYDIDMKYKYEIKNGNGYIKEFYENGCLKYEGDIKEGKKKEKENYMMNVDI